MAGAGQHRAVELGLGQRHIAVGARALKRLEGAILGPGEHDDLRIGNHDPHAAFGDRFRPAHPVEHRT